MATSLSSLLGGIYTGPSGFSGYSGAGVSGFSGFSGAGVSGFSGFSGAGVSGFSGFSGAAVSSISNGTSNVSIPTVNGNILFSVNGTANVVTFYQSNLTVGTGTAGSITGANSVSATYLLGFVEPSAGTTTDAPIQLQAGTNLTSANVGAIEFDGTAIYATNNATSGRGELGIIQEYRYTTAGSALGPAITDYFPATSSLSLQSASIYEVEAVAYFLKTTAGTVTFTWALSSGVNLARSYYVGTVATGFTTTTVTGTPVTGMATAQGGAITTLAHAATGSLTTAVFHHYHFKVHIYTNAATNIRLRVTCSAGTVTPQAGSYYWVRKIAVNTGNFAA